MLDIVCTVLVVSFISLALSKNFRYSVHNVNAYVNTFFSFKLLLVGNAFFMEYLSATASSDILQKSFSERFQKIPQKTPLKLEESLFLMMLQTLYLKLYKNAILTSMFSYKFWEFFRTTFPLKTLCDYLWGLFIL